MRKIKQLSETPAERCAVTLRADDNEGFFDPNVRLNGWDPAVAISFAAVREMARELGLVDKALLDDAYAERDDALAELFAAQSFIAKSEELQQAEAELVEIETELFDGVVA